MIASLRNHPPGQITRPGQCRYQYFLKVLAVTATLNANSVANGSTMKVGLRLNGSARYITQLSTSKGIVDRFAQ